MGPVAVSVLTADDSPAFRAALGELVDATPGWELVAATSSGEEAVGLAERLRPDVALIDVRMGGIDGIEAAAQIVALGGETLVVVLSAGDLEPLAARAGAAGVTAVVDKRRLRPGVLQEIWAAYGAPARA
jgi:DNA-binding NarL/FixJ family response regulator